jgi:hypothetical protein
MLGFLGAAGYGFNSLLSGSSRKASSSCNGTSPAGTANPINGESFIQDNLWTTGREQYAVWVGLDGIPFAGVHRLCSCTWRRVNLGALPGNPLHSPTGSDGHDDYVIAVDSLGYVHIVGNMHSIPLRYIRSTYPREITQWVTGTMPGPTDSVTYPQFTQLPNGTLQFWYRDGVSGEGQELLNELLPKETAWRSMGTILDGRPTHESPYLNHIALDPVTGMVGLMFEWRRSPNPSTTSDVGYAQSPDGGRTWETAAGTPLPVPITHDVENTILKTVSSGSGLENNGGLTIDTRGHPHGVVVFGKSGGTQDVQQLWFDGRRWHRQLLGDVLEGRPAIASTPDGRVWLLGAFDNTLEAVDVTPGQNQHRRITLAPVPTSWEAVYDSQELSLHGKVQVLIPDGDRPVVVQADLP